MDAFETLVADAIDALPEEFQRLLETVPVVVSELGIEQHAYGEYYGEYAVTRNATSIDGLPALA